MWAPEKGVDTAIVTDLLSLAGEEAYDVAILVSSDADHIPAVEWIQAHGRKVINAGAGVASRPAITPAERSGLNRRPFAVS